MAYGARLESVLGSRPRGFESPILRRWSPVRRRWTRRASSFGLSSNLARLVKQLTVAERFWFGGRVFDDLGTAAALTGGDTVTDLVARYEHAARESDVIIAGWGDLDEIIETPVNGRPRCTPRWIVQHMITERLATRGTPTSCESRSTGPSAVRPPPGIGRPTPSLRDPPGRHQ